MMHIGMRERPPLVPIMMHIGRRERLPLAPIMMLMRREVSGRSYYDAPKEGRQAH